MLVGGGFETNFLAEPAGPPRSVNQAQNQPGSAEQFGDRAQAEPDAQANQETHYRRHQVTDRPPLLADAVVQKRGDVDPHETDKRAEVQQLDVSLVRDYMR